jgi:serine/threonine protein kinase
LNIGAFGRVVGALNRSTGHEVAMKIMEKANCAEQDIQRIKGEINNLYKFSHVSPNFSYG